MNPMKFNRTRGFTLVEVLAALVIFMLGIMGVMGMQYMAVRGNAASRELRVATNLAQSLLEQGRGMGYSDLTTLGSGIVPIPTTDLTATGGVNFTNAVWIVQNCRDLQLTSASSGGDDLTCDDDNRDGALDGDLVPACVSGATLTGGLAIRSRLCWLDRDGANHSVTLNSMRWYR